MQADPIKHEWDVYCKEALSKLIPSLARMGYTLDSEQPHITGERFLIRPINGGRKLVLIGHQTKDHQKVVIKASDDPIGIKEIEHERACRDTLKHIPFAYQLFHTPHELAFVHREGFAIMISKFIEQEIPFMERPIEKQFALALRTFKEQEGAHATTYEHYALVAHTFGEANADHYCSQIRKYTQDITSILSETDNTHAELDAALHESISCLCTNHETLERYGGFLTHWDFTPQNFRVQNNKVYLLDLSSLRLGNKYESWARFINFMELYNPALARALITYVQNNRTPEESEALKMMRIYRLVELIRFYASWIPRAKDELLQLTHARIKLWSTVLRATLDNKTVAPSIITEYKDLRDRLRSEDEKKRQVDLH